METILIFEGREFERYFRRHMFEVASSHGLELIYIHVDRNRLDMTRFVSGSPETHRVRYRDLLQYRGAAAMVFNFGLSSALRQLFFRLLLRPGITCWDYIDDYYYGNETLARMWYHKWFAYVSDKVLVLNPLLGYRFENAVHWQFGSHLARRPSSPPDGVVGTIASIDARFDFASYRHAIAHLPDRKFVLYGWAEQADVQTTQALERLSEFENFSYGGAYADADLQSILAGFTVGLIPYCVSALTLNINPDKYYHYANVGLPVISSYIPALLDKPAVAFYRTGDELVELIRNHPAPPESRSSPEDMVQTLKSLVHE